MPSYIDKIMQPVKEEKIMAYTVEDVNNCTKKINFKFEDVDLTTQIEQALKEKFA